MPWYLWILLGLFLLLLELLTPGGFFFLFFGVAALLLAPLAALDWAGPAWLHWILFSAVSVALLLMVRPRVAGKVKPAEKPVDALVGERALVLEDVPAGGVGKVELRGSSWSARSAQPVPLQKGLRCRVDKVEGLTLWVRPE